MRFNRRGTRPPSCELLHALRPSTSLLVRSALLAGMVGTCVGVALAATPKEQKAIVQTGTGGPEVLKLQTLPVPQPGENQVLIKVYAAAVNPVDWKIRLGTAGAPPVAGAAPSTSIPGEDVAGIVDGLGGGVTNLKVGDPVFALIPRSPGALNGGYSEFAVAPTANVVPKPRNITYAQAAGLGVAGVTGVRAVNVTQVAKGQRVLITGVAGGVGSSAAQAAKARGAYVIGTASAQHNVYLRSIGVDEVIDYTRVRFEDQVKNVDVVIDTVGSDTAERALTTLKKGGMYVSVAARGLEDKCAAAGVICATRGSASEAGRGVFDEVGSLAAAGKLKVYLDKTFPLDQAAQAQTYSQQGHAQGKIILVVNAVKANEK